MASPVPANLVCSPNAATVYDFLIGKGLRDFQAAAVIGNLQQESRLNPVVSPGDGGRSHGIAQWNGSRWKDLQDFASNSGLSPDSIEAQLGFLWHELETNPSAGLDQLEASTSIEEAVQVFQDMYERCGTCETDKRIAFAKSALYSCPGVAPPVVTKPSKMALATTGALALAGAAAFGIYEAIRMKRRKR